MVGTLRSSNRTSPGAWRTAPRMVPRLPRLATDDSVSASLTTFSLVLLIMGNLRSHLQGEGLKVPIAHDGHSEAGHGGGGWTGGRAGGRTVGEAEGRRDGEKPHPELSEGSTADFWDLGKHPSSLRFSG